MRRRSRVLLSVAVVALGGSATLPSAAAPRRAKTATTARPAPSPRAATTSPAPSPAETVAAPTPSAGAAPLAPVVSPPIADRVTEPRAPTDAPKNVDNATIVVEPRVGVAARWFDYRDRVSSGLRSFELVATPVVGVAAEVYPGALAGSSPVANALGLCGAFSAAVGAVAKTASTELNVDWSAFDAGVCARAPLGRVTLGASVSYGGVDFSFDGRTTPETASASARYRFVRGAARAKVAISEAASLEATAGGMSLSDLGPLTERFPRATGAGIFARVGGALRVARAVELRPAIAYERFFFALHPEPGDVSVAGGAHDDQARLEASVALFF